MMLMMLMVMMNMEAVIIILFASGRMRVINDHGSNGHFPNSAQCLCGVGDFTKPTSCPIHLIVCHNNLWLNRNK